MEFAELCIHTTMLWSTLVLCFFCQQWATSWPCSEFYSDCLKQGRELWWTRFRNDSGSGCISNSDCSQQSAWVLLYMIRQHWILWINTFNHNCHWLITCSLSDRQPCALTLFLGCFVFSVSCYGPLVCFYIVKVNMFYLKESFWLQIQLGTTLVSTYCNESHSFRHW